MKILFVSSGNSGRISPITKAQADSLEKEGVFIDFFLIKEKGILGYTKHIFKLKNYIHENDYDVIHAHFSLSAYVATLAGARPLVVSLMGSDVKRNKLLSLINKVGINFLWKETIVKSNDMKETLKVKKVNVIPNGVDLKIFRPMNRQNCQDKLGWNSNNVNILFAGKPSKNVKNFDLFSDSFKRVKTKYSGKIKYYVLDDVAHSNVPIYMNAADIVCLSSKWEGSPNVIKEAMACNRIALSTDVGNVARLFYSQNGYYIAEQDVTAYSNKLLQAIKYSQNNNTTNGRKRLIELGLDSKSVAQKIISLYEYLI